MFKKIFMLALIASFVSCESEKLNDSDENTEFKELPIVYVDKVFDDLSRGNNFLQPFEEFSLSSLDSSCDLSSFSFADIANNVNWFDPNSNSGFNPYANGYFSNNTYGQLPSSYLTESLTYILNDLDFIHSPSIMPPTLINPVTGNQYHQTVLNNYYHEYRFKDYEVFNTTTYQDEFQFLFNDMTPLQSNLVRDIIACKLLQEANIIDPTAFIQDVGVQSDWTALVNNENNNVTRILSVWVKWGYHN